MGTIFGGVGTSNTWSAANGGKVTAVVVGTSAAQCITGNAQRQSLVFHNPGTATIYVAPTTNAQGAALVINVSNLQGTFMLPGGATLVLSGECQGSWQSFAASLGSPLTIMESNV